MYEIIASSDLHFKWSFGSHLLLGMPFGLMKHCFFFQLLCWGNLQWGSRKLGLMQNGVQNSPVISNFLVEDYLQRCFTYRTFVCPCQLRIGNSTVYFLWLRTQCEMAGLKGTAGKIRPYSPAKVNVKWQMFCFLRQNSTRNIKCDPTTKMELK